MAAQAHLLPFAFSPVMDRSMAMPTGLSHSHLACCASFTTSCKHSRV